MSQALTQPETSEQTTVHRLNFNDDNREAHLQALYAWLPPNLRDAPLIDWTRLSSRIIGYLVRTVGASDFAQSLALAMGVIAGSVSDYALWSMLSRLHHLFQHLQKVCGVRSVTDLTKEVWVTFVTKEVVTSDRYYQLQVYRATTQTHVWNYVELLTEEQRQRLENALLPRLPRQFLQQYVNGAAIEEEVRRRKGQTDVLAPLHHVLVALIHYRYQAMKRLLHAFHEACEQAKRVGRDALPLSFTYDDELVTVNRNARTVADIRLEKQPVTLQFVLWDRRTWVLHHGDHYHEHTIKNATHRRAGFTLAQDFFFLQFLGKPEELLWCGNLIKDRCLQARTPQNISSDEIQRRKERLAELGRTEGLECRRPGIFTSGFEQTRVLSEAIFRTGALLFEPESLYRATLYGAALAQLSLTNGSRSNELLQVSADRFKIHMYEAQKDGQSTGEQRAIRLQHLLPKGKKTESERKLFLVSDRSYDLLREIAQNLKEAHDGHIPIVRPHSYHTKRQDLSPERYLFQWAATPDGRYGAFHHDDINDLLVFILYGLEFRTKQGEPFVVSTHLLRHVMATVARHGYDVPVEAVAYALHHTQQGVSGQAMVSEATEYYSQESEERFLVAFAEFQIDLEEWVSSLEVGFPDERTLEQMDDDLRDVFERWQTLLETTFGFCGRVSLCPRGYQRNLCIGCPHLVADHRKRPIAAKWRQVYAKQAEEHERDGNTIDARQNRLLVRELDDLINSMDVMAQALDYGHTPLFLQLPTVPYDEVFSDA